MSANRDYASEYFDACIDDRTPGATLAQRGQAWNRMERIFDDADAAGVDLDVLGIDERARLALYPTSA